VHRIISGDEYSHFELAEDLTSHHHHLVCTSCGRVADVTLSDEIEASLDRALARVAADEGFHAEHHRLDVIGRCSSCV
jgi:Fe2+ or Zn2+ uptake regulation protein